MTTSTSNPGYVVSSARKERMRSSSTRDRSRTVGWFTRVGQIALASVILVTPWLFGSVHALPRLLLVCTMAALVMVWWCSLIFEGQRAIRIPLTVVPMLLLLAIGIGQLVPLPPSVMEIVAPKQVELRDEFSIVGSDRQANTLQPVTLNQSNTIRDLTLLLVGVSAFVLAGTFYRRRTAFLWLAVAVMINGAALSLFGMVQAFTWNGKHFWMIPHTVGGPFSSFVNANNAAGYLNLALGCAVAIVIWICSPKRRRGATPAFSDLGGESKLRAFLRPLIGFVADLNAVKLAAILGGVVIIGGVFCSLSRGGIVACLGAAVVTAILLTLSRRHQLAGALVLSAVILAGLMTWVIGETPAINDELATINQQELAGHERLAMWQDVVPAVSDFWLLGSGMGCFRHVYRMYRVDVSDDWFYHADNHYLETLIDLGVIGLALVLVFVVWMIWTVVYLIRKGETTTDVAIGAGVCFALVSQILHGFVDFGMYIPANLLLCAVLCGASSCHALRLALNRRTASLSLRPLPAWPAAALPVVLFACFVLAIPCSYNYFRMDSKLRGIDRLTARQNVDDQELRDRAADLLETVNKVQSEDGYRRLGDLYVYGYRQALMERLTENAREEGIDIEPEQLSALTDLTMLHGRVQTAYATNGQTGLEEQRSDPLVQIYLRPAYHCYLNAIRCCPLMTIDHMRIAQLSFLDESPTENKIHVGHAVALAPTRHDILAIAGLMDAQAGRIDRAIEHWRRSIVASTEYHQPIVTEAINVLSPDQFVDDLFPDDPELLFDVAQKRLPDSSDVQIRAKLLDRVEQLITGLEAPSYEQVFIYGRILEDRGEYLAAADQYERAVLLSPDNPETYYRLAFVYFNQGDVREASDRIARGLILTPANKRFLQLQKKIDNARKTPASRTSSPHTAQAGPTVT